MVQSAMNLRYEEKKKWKTICRYSTTRNIGVPMDAQGKVEKWSK